MQEAAEVKDHLAYMSQKFGLYQDLTVGENIDFYADLYGMSRKGRQKRIEELLDFSHMRPFIRRRAGDLSGGMKQKLQLVCALIHTPKVLLLDEPTNGVDPVSRRDFWRILNQLREQQVAVLLTTAYLDEAERCDRVGLIDKGKLMAVGTPAEMKELMDGRILAISSRQARKIVTLLRETNLLPKASISLAIKSIWSAATAKRRRKRSLTFCAGRKSTMNRYTRRNRPWKIFLSACSAKATKLSRRLKKPPGLPQIRPQTLPIPPLQ